MQLSKKFIFLFFVININNFKSNIIANLINKIKEKFYNNVEFIGDSTALQEINYSNVLRSFLENNFNNIFNSIYFSTNIRTSARANFRFIFLTLSIHFREFKTFNVLAENFRKFVTFGLMQGIVIIRSIFVRPLIDNFSLGYLKLHNFDLNNIELSEQNKKDYLSYKTGFAIQINNCNQIGILKDLEILKGDRTNIFQKDNESIFIKEILLSLVINPDFSKFSNILSFLKEKFFFNFGIKYQINSYKYTMLDNFKGTNEIIDILKHLLEVIIPQFKLEQIKTFKLNLFFAINFAINVGFLKMSISYKFNFDEIYYNFISSLNNLSVCLWLVKIKENNNQENIQKLIAHIKEAKEEKERKQELLQISTYDKNFIL